MCLLLLCTYSAHPSTECEPAMSARMRKHMHANRRGVLTIVCSVHYWNSFIMCVYLGVGIIFARLYSFVCACSFFYYLFSSCNLCLASMSYFVGFFFVALLLSLVCLFRISFHSIANKIINNRVKIMALGFCVPHTECVKFQALVAFSITHISFVSALASLIPFNECV